MLSYCTIKGTDGGWAKSSTSFFTYTQIDVVTFPNGKMRDPNNFTEILDSIKNNPKITAPQIAMELGISTRGVEKNLRILREAGILKRIGSPTFGGHWEITTSDNE